MDNEKGSKTSKSQDLRGSKYLTAGREEMFELSCQTCVKISRFPSSIHLNKVKENFLLVFFHRIGYN